MNWIISLILFLIVLSLVFTVLKVTVNTFLYVVLVIAAIALAFYLIKALFDMFT